jgi:hypothetical protein
MPGFGGYGKALDEATGRGQVRPRRRVTLRILEEDWPLLRRDFAGEKLRAVEAATRGFKHATRKGTANTYTIALVLLEPELAAELIRWQRERPTIRERALARVRSKKR